MQYPKIKYSPIQETIFGKKVSDPFRSLEEKDSAETLQWIKKQNLYTEKILKTPYTKERRLFTAELKKYTDLTIPGVPMLFRGKYFYSAKKKNAKQYSFFFKRSLYGKGQILIDPEKIDPSGKTTFTFAIPSPQTKFLAYGLSEKGTEAQTLSVLDIKTKKIIDQIPHIAYGGVRWMPDENGFYYVRLPIPGSVPKGEERYHGRVYFHKLKTSWKKDKLIFGEGRHKEDMFLLVASDDGNYLAIGVMRNWMKNEVYLYHAPTNTVSTIIKDIHALFHVSIAQDKIFLHTNHNAPRYKVLYAQLNNIPRSLHHWNVFLPEHKTAIIEDIRPTANNLLVLYNKNATSMVNIHDYSGKLRRHLAMPPLSDLMVLTNRKTEKEFFFKTTSFLSSGTTYRYDENGKISIYQKAQFSLDPKKYSVRQEWFSSKDGTKVPMFIFSKKTIKKTGKNPTLLYGYGGFGISQKPGFLKFWLPFINRGGILAIANIRGGGEFGTEWHKMGILKNKQKSFDDFIAAAEYLIKKKYTHQNKLAIMGGSNGGLLVAACAIQRPDLYKAVISQVPLTDMIRFPRYYIASRWISEYGDPKIKDDARRILKWSPYHNVKENIEYPSFFFTTGVNDTRVHPMHAWKMTAALQRINKKNPVLLWTQMDTGHGIGTPLNVAIENQSNILAFLDSQIEFTKQK